MAARRGHREGDLLQNIAISTLIQDPRNADTLYAGTGEGYYNLDALRGAGIFKSTDGGETWNQLASTANSDSFDVQKMAITKGATQRIYAATRTGLFRSLDGGATFTKVFDVAANGLVRGCMDINYLYLSRNRIRYCRLRTSAGGWRTGWRNLPRT